MVGKAVYARLSTETDITDLTSLRIRPGMLRQGDARPAITYYKISNVHENYIGGGVGLSHARVQVDCWADTHKEAETLADAARLRLTAFSGTSGGVVVDSSLLIEDSDGDEAPLFATDVTVARVSMDFSIWYREATS